MPTLTHAEVTRAVQEAIAAILPTVDAERITAFSSWQELEADSVDRVEILCWATENLGLPALDVSLESAPTVEALIHGILIFGASLPSRVDPKVRGSCAPGRTSSPSRPIGGQPVRHPGKTPPPR